MRPCDHGRRYPNPCPLPVCIRCMRVPSEVDCRFIRLDHRIALLGCDSLAHRDDVAWPSVTPSLTTGDRKGGSGTLALTHANAFSSAPLPSPERYHRPWIPRLLRASRPRSDVTLTVRGSAPTQHAIGNWREPTRNNGQTSDRQKPESTGPFKIRTSAMTCGYYRTSSPVTALPMIMRWISDVPSKIVKLVKARAVSAGRWPAGRSTVSTNSVRLGSGLDRWLPTPAATGDGRRPQPQVVED